MTLKVIGSGFGRTGTKSMKEALEMIGFGPAHHMIELINDPAQIARWKAVASGEEVDWAEVYKGYVSQVDWPGAHVWYQAMIAFPDAKVIHTERPEDAWWTSFSTTIGKSFNTYKTMPLPPHVIEVFDTMSRWFLTETFSDHTDRASAIKAYRANNERVRDTVPADRLMIFNVADGWAPLCNFLSVPVPTAMFPHRHPRAEFWEMFGGEPV